MLHSLDVIGAGLFAFLGASAIVGGLALWARKPATLRPAMREPVVFLFEGSHLVDATPAARRALKSRPAGGPDLSRLLQLLERGFGADLGQRLATLPVGGRLSLASLTGAGTLDIAEEGGALRLTLRPEDVGASVLDQLAFDAAQAEVHLLSGLAENSPHPIWAMGPGGELTWANNAYLALADLASASPAEPSRAEIARTAWPLRPLFGPVPDLSEDGSTHHERLPLNLPDCEEPSWHDVTSIRRDTQSLHFATDVTELVQAEAARLHFVQTLAKTFAHLATGLAVFDRDRRLVLFNPAFLDLTGLPVDFLSGRPLVQAVLDRLRDARILPEPRDYTAWRESVAALEVAAAQGQYCETWTLPGGQTYRVTGRPHPDGALAFLFEDITGEVGLARRVRTELEATRGVLDALEDAVAVFSSTGALTLSNMAYTALWGPPNPPAPEPDLMGEAARWQAGCLPSPVWTRFRRPGTETPTPTVTELRLRNGQALTLHAAPLPQGALLVRFHVETIRITSLVDGPELVPSPVLHPAPA